MTNDPHNNQTTPDPMTPGSPARAGGKPLLETALKLWWVWGLGAGLAAGSVLGIARLDPHDTPASHLPGLSGPDYSVLAPATPHQSGRITAWDHQREKSQIAAGDSFMPVAQGDLETGDSPKPAVLPPGTAPASAVPSAPVWAQPGVIGQSVIDTRAGLRDAIRDPAAPKPQRSRVADSGPAQNAPDLKQIEVLFNQWHAQTARKPDWAMIDYAATRQDSPAARAGGAPSFAGAAVPSGPEGKRPVLIPAGAVAWASLQFTYDSDLPDMPVISTLHGGKFDGATLIGRATPVRDQTVIQFDRLARAGQSYAIEAWAVGAQCDCLALASAYDPRLLTTVILPAAVDFITGFGLPELARGTKVTINDGTVIADSRAKRTRDRLLSGASQTARRLYDRFAEILPKGGHSRVWRGVPHAVIFTKEVRG